MDADTFGDDDTMLSPFALDTATLRPSDGAPLADTSASNFEILPPDDDDELRGDTRDDTSPHASSSRVRHLGSPYAVNNWDGGVSKDFSHTRFGAALLFAWALSIRRTWLSEESLEDILRLTVKTGLL